MLYDARSPRQRRRSEPYNAMGAEAKAEARRRLSMMLDDDDQEDPAQDSTAESADPMASAEEGAVVVPIRRPVPEEQPRQPRKPRKRRTGKRLFGRLYRKGYKTRDWDKVDRQAVRILLERDASAAVMKVYLVLLQHYSEDRQEAWPSQSLLAEETGVPERTVRYALNWLESNGVIGRAKNADDSPKYRDRCAVWLLPSRAVLDRDLDKHTHVGAKAFIMRLLDEKSPATIPHIKDGHLARVVKQHGDKHGYEWVCEQFEAWLAKEGTQRHEDGIEKAVGLFDGHMKKEGGA